MFFIYNRPSDSQAGRRGFDPRIPFCFQYLIGFFIDLATQGIAYVPFFPLEGFSPLQSSVLNAAASSLRATPMQVALAWLLEHSPNILLIPGTSSVKHLRENLNAATLHIPSEMIADLDSIGGGAAQRF
jgi:pyridoxine 4-dehydrogenase